MDLSLALRLDSQSPHYDSELYGKCAKLAADYARAGLATLEFFTPDFDGANDLANALATLPTDTNASKFDKLDRSQSKNFSHPCGATQVDVLATAISQILFGGETNRRVEPRNDDDKVKADAMNELLAWNSAQNQEYRDGFLFVKDAIICNRGVTYDYWCDLYELEKVPVEYTIPALAQIDPKTRRKIAPPADQKPQKATRYKTVRKKVGGYVKLTNISPYDFICDPSIPLSRLNESGRYAGHRVMLTWQELDARSKLPPTDYQYVLPEVVKKLKNSKMRKGISGTGASQNVTTSTSRSHFERQRRGNPTPEVGMTERINKDDGGVIECWCITIRTRPATHGIYEDEENEMIEFLLAGSSDLLSVNVMPNTHGDFPYAVAEERPNAHMQFSPSTAMLLKPTQNMIDTRKGAHEEQVERSGLLLLAKGTKCDIAQVMDDKTRIRQVILTTDDAEGDNLDNILKPIPMPDATATFMGEMAALEDTMEKTCGGFSQLQGETEDPSQTATQFDGVQQMAFGRLSTKARNISSGCLERQTRRIAMNLQQFLSDTQTIRITGKSGDFDPDVPQAKHMTIRREPLDEAVKAQMEATYAAAVQQAISQGLPPPPRPPELDQPDIAFSFDVTPHDGSLPGVNAKAVAAAARLVEASANPAFAACFDNTVPGNYDPRALISYIAEESGMPVNNFRITRETAQKNLQEKMLAQGMGMPQAGMQQQAQPSTLPAGPQPPVDPMGGPAIALPPNPSASPPQIRPENA